MEITNQPLSWDSEDVALWRQFLESQTGQRLFPKAADYAPVLFRRGDTNEILIRNGELLGFQAAISTLLALAYPPQEQKQTSDSYPPLDDDAAWNDGQTTKR